MEESWLYEEVLVIVVNGNGMIMSATCVSCNTKWRVEHLNVK